MLGLVFRALVARRAQALWLAVLTALSVAGAAAAPWYHAAAVELVTASDIAAAPANQRAVMVTGRVNQTAQPSGVSPLPQLREEVGRLLELPEATVVVGLQALATVQHGTPPATGGPPAGDVGRVSTLLAFREDVCAHLDIEGACPSGTGEIVVSTATAEALGARRGDEVTITSFQQRAPATFRVVGIYEPIGLDGTYWVATGLLSSPLTFQPGQSVALYGDAVFTTEEGLLDARPSFVDTTYQAVLPDSTFSDGSRGGLPARLSKAEWGLGRSGYGMRTTAGALATLIERDRRLTTVGVGVAAAQLLLLCWFCLFLAVRHTAEERRTDIGMLKLRGASRWRVWALTAQQSGWPMLAGTVVGWGLGYLAASLLLRLGNPARVPMTGGAALSVAAAVLAAVGALAVATAAEWRALGTPVTGLLRRVPARRSGWRADVVDLMVVLVAAAGIYQAWAERGARDATPLPLLAPALMALALGLLAARALPLLAARLGVGAMRAGRAGPALAMLHLARRPGTNRVVAMLVVAVALLCTATLAWQSAGVAAQRRATQELGAARVITVTADTPDRVLVAVRRADPEGRYAMATARVPGSTNVGTALAVDATRLARVALWLDEYGITADEAARALRPPVPATLTAVDGTLTLDARVPPDAQPAIVTAVMADPEGRRLRVRFGPVAPGSRGASAVLSGCPPASPCRVIGFHVEGPVAELRQLEGAAGTVVSSPTFGDTARWRPAVGMSGLGVNVAPMGDRLRITDSFNPLPGNQVIIPDTTVYAVDAPVPLPIVASAGKIAADPVGDDRISPIGSSDVPFRIAADAAALPQLGRGGGYFDLESAIKVVSFPGRFPSYEVWLTEDAPPSVRDSLTGAGLTVLREDTIEAAVARYSRQGPGTALKFFAFTAAIGVLLAAGSLFVVAAVERGPRAAELAALRAQGLPSAALRTTGYLGPALLVTGSVLVGLLAAVLARATIQAAMPVFTDGWQVLPVDTGPRAAPLLVAAGIALAALATASVIAAAQTVRLAGGTGPGEGS
jgi:hypothetical protein